MRGQGHTRRRILALAAVATVCGSQAASAPAASGSSLPSGQPLEVLAAPTRVSSFGGWSAWSRWEAASRSYRLIVRDPEGVIAPASVPPRTKPFDLELGPTAAGGVAAVYSRCSVPARYRGCHLFELPLSGEPSIERPLAVPGAGSDFSPAIWKGRIAFLRASPRSSLGLQEEPEGFAGCQPHQELLEWQIGAHRAVSLKLPVTKWPKPGPGEVEEPQLTAFDGCAGRITYLTLRETSVAYVLLLEAGPVITNVSLLTQFPHRKAVRRAIEGTGGAAFAGLRWFLSPVLSGGWLYAYEQFSEQGLRWIRMRLGSKTVQEAQLNFEDIERHAVQAVQPLGEGVIWSRRDSESQGENTPPEPTSVTRIMYYPHVRWTRFPFRRAGTNAGF